MRGQFSAVRSRENLFSLFDERLLPGRELSMQRLQKLEQALGKFADSVRRRAVELKANHVAQMCG